MFDYFECFEKSARMNASRKPRSPLPARDVGLVVHLSVPTAPLMSVIERHVKLSAAVKSALEQDLAQTLGHAGVQLTAVEATRQDDVLSTEQAARLLGVSRPYVARLIDEGAIALHQRVGNQRRVLRSSVLVWQVREKSRQAKALKRLADELDDELFRDA